MVEPFGPSGEITACLTSTDEKTKVFTFYYEIKANDKAKTGITLNHITEATNKLQRVQSLFEIISRNIYIKNDIDKELTDCKFRNCLMNAC